MVISELFNHGRFFKRALRQKTPADRPGVVPAPKENQEVLLGSIVTRVITDINQHGFTQQIDIPPVLPDEKITGQQATSEMLMFYIGPHGEPYTATLTAMKTETDGELELALTDDDSAGEILVYRAGRTQTQVANSMDNPETFLLGLSSARIDKERLEAEFRNRQLAARKNPNTSVSWNKGKPPVLTTRYFIS